MIANRTLMRLVIAAAGMFLAAGFAQACVADVHLSYKEPVTLEGVLKTKTGHHDAQGDFKVYYLVLDAPVCLDPSEDDAGTEEPVAHIQVAGDALGANPPVGSRVKATGSLFPAHTQWHVEPVLIDASALEALK